MAGWKIHYERKFVGKSTIDGPFSRKPCLMTPEGIKFDNYGKSPREIGKSTISMENHQKSPFSMAK